MENIADRLKQLMDEMEMNPANFADEIRVQRSGISHILSGRNKPSLEFIEKLSKRYPRTDLRWLITGKASQIADQSEVESEKIEDDPKVKYASPPVQNRSEKIILLKSNNTFEEYFPAE